MQMKLKQRKNKNYLGQKINYIIYTVDISFNTTKEVPLRVKIFAFHPRHSKHSITLRPPAPPWEKDTAFLLTWHHR